MSTYTPIASQTAGGSVSSITFSSIPQGYTDLVLVFTGSVTSGSGDLGLRFNSDTGSNYSTTWLSSQAGGTSGKSTSATSITATEYSYLDNVRSTLTTINLLNYSNNTTHKSLLTRSGKTGYGVEAKVGRWRNTDAITSITAFTTGSNPNFTSGSTFSIYGIQVGQAAQKAQGGNIVTTDGTYVYHTFTSSGAFIPSETLTVDYLVVAGGGGGGFAYYPTSSQVGGAGGGAGGVRCTVGQTGGLGTLPSALSLTAKAYTVTIGAGGAGGIGSSQIYPTQGGPSTFATISCTGGGTGGSTNGTNYASGGNGGSGGGGAYSGTKGLKTANEGFDGADGNTTTNATGGGGGGAGAAAPATTVVSGVGYAAGGDGISTNISGSSTYYGGGGGGSTYAINGNLGGGLGGGGAGGQGSGVGNNGTSGTTNAGGGGGAASGLFGGTTSLNGGNGGSGIVVIRYAI